MPLPVAEVKPVSGHEEKSRQGVDGHWDADLWLTLVGIIIIVNIVIITMIIHWDGGYNHPDDDDDK